MICGFWPLNHIPGDVMREKKQRPAAISPCKRLNAAELQDVQIRHCMRSQKASSSYGGFSLAVRRQICVLLPSALQSARMEEQYRVYSVNTSGPPHFSTDN